jgi:hypothetical protein
VKIVQGEIKDSDREEERERVMRIMGKMNHKYKNYSSCELTGLLPCPPVVAAGAVLA